MSNFPLFHWSPSVHRESITERGLVVGSLALAGTWTPPYICFADDPEVGWGLRGKDADGQPVPVAEWDLWMMHSDVPERLEALFAWYPDIERVGPKEYRVHEHIAADCLWYVGMRVTP